MNLEVLVATMGQRELTLDEKMNIRCDAIIANQCNEWKYDEKMTDFGRVRMLSSATVGVGKNRNLAMAMSEAEIVLFADDDIIYYDGMPESVKKAFDELPDADMIFFGLDMTRGGAVFEKRREPIKRRRLWNALKYGAGRMAVRRSSLEKYGIGFSELFGGGCLYGSGEDSLLIRECLRHGMKAYSYAYVLGTCAKDNSSWFEGFNEKFFFDKGAWIACAFPKSKHIIKFYFACRFAKKAGVSVKKVMRQINRGMSAFSSLEGYN